ncbi:MAG: toll/interleukin-1 receptor domain-containing protein [Thiohalocapsa sp.]
MMRIFISHSIRDRDFVLSKLKPALEARGSAPWCSSTDFKAAANWEQQIRTALAASDWFTVVMSPDSQCSEWVQAETHWAVEHMPRRIIPILVRSCRPIDLHLRLGTLQYIDFQAGFESAFRDLLQLIQHPGLEDAGEECSAESSEETARTTLMKRPRSASLLVHVVRVSAPA